LFEPGKRESAGEFAAGRKNSVALALFRGPGWQRELPDVVAYSPSKNWLYLIEAVTSSGPISYSRREKFKILLKDCKAELIFVTSFPDKKIMRKHLDDLAWETEVWLSSDPDHLVHLNGDKFLGPHKD
jgi:type II restriction enzyme